MSQHTDRMDAIRRKIAARSLRGMACAIPGCYETTNLHIDHQFNQRSWDNSNAGWNRPAMYEAEFKANPDSLRLLCRKHNCGRGSRLRNGGVRKNYHVTDRKCFCSRCRPRHEPTPECAPILRGRCAGSSPLAAQGIGRGGCKR